ncbi:MAG TPA: ABC transporter substrate-binding protein [Methanospirillum sp.]|nr:ABC transporter substrate-binding protein [Methanospirillum sp.]
MNRPCVSFFSVILILLLLIFLGSPASAALNKTFTCGVILPLSGSFGTLGTEVLQGIECAADQINAEGGANGYTVQLETADDMSDPDQASFLFADMKKRGIPVVIGSLTTALTLPMAEQTKPDPTISVLLISPRANGNDLYGISPGFYQVHSPAFHLGDVVADWLSYTADRAALVYIDDAYGLSFAETIKQRLNTSSTVISAEVPISHDDVGFSLATIRILDAVSDTVVIIGCDTESVTFMRALSDAGFDGQIVLTESCLIKSLSADLINNTPGKFSLFTANAYTTLVPGRESDRFVADYLKKFGKSPEGSVAGYGYDALIMIQEALIHTQQTGNVTASSLKEGLDAIRYYGVTGPKIFDQKNAVSPAYDRYIYRNGTFDILSTSIR